MGFRGLRYMRSVESCLANDCDEVAAFNLGCLRDGNALNLAVLGSRDGGFHLHCFDDSNLIASLDFVADLHGWIDDTREWRSNMAFVLRVCLFHGGSY